MQKNIIIFWVVFVLTVLSCVGALLLPTPLSWPAENAEFHQLLIINIIVAATHSTGAIFFLANLDVYKTKLRRAYTILALGALMTGAGTLQISILTLLNLWETPYGQSGATMIPFLLVGLILYMAVRSFAQLIGVKHILAKAYVAIPAALLLVVVSTLLPHANDPAIAHESVYDVLVGISVWSSSLMFFSWLIARKVEYNAGRHYTYAIRWLKRALLVSGFVFVYVAFYTLVSNGSSNVVLDTLNSTTTVISGLAWTRAGFAFALTKFYNTDMSMIRVLFTRPRATTGSGPDTVIDMVTSTAGLASNVREIDPLLDKVRAITSRLGPDEQLSPKEVDELVDVYLYIETYLTTKEAIRTFTTRELRARLSPELRRLLESRNKEV